MKSEKIDVGLVGCGFIGTALKVWLEENNPNVILHISDPAKGYDENVYENEEIDAFFIQIHVPTLENGKQDIGVLEDIIRMIPKGKDIWIRTTTLPKNLKKLKEINEKVHHMPEFLTERTYIEDFRRQKMVFTGNIGLLERIFPGKGHICMSSMEASLAKYAHNVFGALKVTYFNAINDICERDSLDFGNVRDGILLSGYINKTHTQVPGPDGCFGYGGKCFPKDVNALSDEYHDTPLGKLIEPLKELNEKFRSKAQ